MPGNSEANRRGHHRRGGFVGNFVFSLTDHARQPAASWFENIQSGAPPLAPLLFPNLATLAATGLWVLYQELTGPAEARPNNRSGAER